MNAGLARAAPVVHPRNTMKKTLLAALVSLSFAAPAVACPEHEEAPRTADKKEAEKAPATTADKAKDAKPVKDAKPAPKTSDTKSDKVSQK
jgi:hypothetical protein